MLFLLMSIVYPKNLFVLCAKVKVMFARCLQPLIEMITVNVCISQYWELIKFVYWTHLVSFHYTGNRICSKLFKLLLNFAMSSLTQRMPLTAIKVVCCQWWFNFWWPSFYHEYWQYTNSSNTVKPFISDPRDMGPRSESKYVR